MNVSFDGLRKNMATAHEELFNVLEEASSQNSWRLEESIEKAKLKMDELTRFIGGLMCCYDPNEKDDFNDLSDEVKLKFFKGGDDE